MLRVISLGAGVQSTTMTLMAAHGELGPLPDAAVFADTGWEPHAVYQHLDWLRSQASSGRIPFPIHIVGNGNIRQALTSAAPGRYAAVPFYLRSGNNDRGVARRQCTKEYKLQPLRRKYRELLGKRSRERIAAGAVQCWIGISTDEVMRAKPSQVAWCVNRWPLIEKRLNRNDCLRWLERHGYPIPPKSSCIGCPFHNDAYWREMKRQRPAEWADAVEVDRLIRSGSTAFNKNVRAQQYMHPSLQPLDQVDLSTLADHGQLDLFNNECEGICNT